MFSKQIAQALNEIARTTFNVRRCTNYTTRDINICFRSYLQCGFCCTVCKHATRIRDKDSDAYKQKSDTPI